MRNLEVQHLTIEEIEGTGASFKEDLQREANRAIRRHDSAAALAALESIERIDTFIHTLKLRAGSQLWRAGIPPRARPIRLFRKKNAPTSPGKGSLARKG
jgi:hypothetical protein